MPGQLWLATLSIMKFCQLNLNLEHEIGYIKNPILPKKSIPTSQNPKNNICELLEISMKFEGYRCLWCHYLDARWISVRTGDERANMTDNV